MLTTSRSGIPGEVTGVDSQYSTGQLTFAPTEAGLLERPSQLPSDQVTNVVLLLGSARSGTTWLANILNSYDDVVYAHEPFTRTSHPEIRAVIDEIKTSGVVGHADRSLLLREWSQAYHDVRRPPFFSKKFRSLPSGLMLLAWFSARHSPWGQKLFKQAFSPRKGLKYQLLVKEVEWALHAHAMVGVMRPRLILIYRHPCAVVASQLEGHRLGLLNGRSAEEWLENHEPIASRLGYSRAEVLRLRPFEFAALRWLATNRLYQELKSAYADTLEVVYERLCTDPLGESRKVFEFLGWEFAPVTERFIRKSTSQGETSLAGRLQFQHPYFRIMRDPNVSMSAWKEKLTADEQERILAIVRPLFPCAEMWEDA